MINEHSFQHNLWVLEHPQLADLDQILNLCYGFILLEENNSTISKSLQSLNIVVWDIAISQAMSKDITGRH